MSLKWRWMALSVFLLCLFTFYGVLIVKSPFSQAQVFLEINHSSPGWSDATLVAHGLEPADSCAGCIMVTKCREQTWTAFLAPLGKTKGPGVGNTTDQRTYRSEQGQAGDRPKRGELSGRGDLPLKFVLNIYHFPGTVSSLSQSQQYESREGNPNNIPRNLDPEHI